MTKSVPSLPRSAHAATIAIGPVVNLRAALGTTLTIAIVVFGSRYAHALDPQRQLGECTVERWSARHGLPSGKVRGFAQTPDGYLWIAGYGPVVRYDGATMVTLPERTEQQARLLDIQTVKLDQDGALWFVSSHGSPTCLRDGLLGECIPAEFPLPRGSRLVDAHPDPDRSVWLATRDNLHRYVPGAPGRLTTLGLPAPGQPVFIHRDRRGRLWLGTQAGLYRQQPDGAFAIAVTAAGPVRTSVRSFFETPKGRLWIALDDHLLWIEDGELQTVKPPGKPIGITQLLEDRDGNLWVGSTTGLMRHRHGEWMTFTAADGLPEDSVSAIFEDREGSLWVGTSNGGVAQFTDRVVVTRVGPESLRDGRIDSLCQDQTGAYWFGTGHGLVRWKDGKERTFGTRDGLPDAHVLVVTAGVGDEVWVGSKAGLARVRAGRIDFPGAVNKSVAALYLDDQGALWIGQDSRLLRWQADRLEEIARSAGENIRTIQADGANQIWVATSSDVSRLEGGRLIPVSLPPRAYRIRDLHRDAEGRLWMTAGSGLFSLSPTGAVRVYGASSASGTAQLFQILDDDRGGFWIGTGRGLLRLPKLDLVAIANGQARRLDALSLDTSDRRRDVIATKTRQPSAWKDNEGRLWFAADQGPLLLDPTRLRLNQRPPTIRIDAAIADGRPLERGLLNDLAPGPGNLEFRYSVVTLLEPRKSLHRYRLDGFDSSWVEAGSRRVAHYTNLPPGRYRFQVQGSNADGVWNEAGDVIELRLRPHLYKTGWFYGVVGLIAFAAAALLWRQRERSLQQQYLGAFRERNRVARELHDTLLQSMAAVALKLRGLRRRLGPQAPDAARELHEIDQLVTTALQETRSFLGDLRGQQGPSDLVVALERLGGRLTEGRDVSCNVTAEGASSNLPNDVKGDLFRIAQEAIQNALKHAEATRIDVGLSQRGGTVVLTVTDDGRGFDDSKAAGAAESHFGLLGMRERAAGIGAAFRLASRPGKGTTIEVTAPLGQHAGEPT